MLFLLSYCIEESFFFSSLRVLTFRRFDGYVLYHFLNKVRSEGLVLWEGVWANLGYEDMFTWKESLVVGHKHLE